MLSEFTFGDNTLKFTMFRISFTNPAEPRPHRVSNHPDTDAFLTTHTAGADKVNQTVYNTLSRQGASDCLITSGARQGKSDCSV